MVALVACLHTAGCAVVTRLMTADDGDPWCAPRWPRRCLRTWSWPWATRNFWNY